jgi:hypothetical protein
VKASSDAPRDNIDNRLAAQGQRRCGMKGNRVPDLPESLLVPVRTVGPGVGLDERSGSVCAIEFEMLSGELMDGVFGRTEVMH